MSGRFVVGLTGGIGSGKSAAAEEFARLGASVVDTDVIARELTAAGGAALPHIKALFGDALVAAIVAQQASRATRRAAADDVIDNSGTLEQLFAQVRALHARYLKMAAQAAA